jgi:hypothetical protein
MDRYSLYPVSLNLLLSLAFLVAPWHVVTHDQVTSLQGVEILPLAITEADSRLGTSDLVRELVARSQLGGDGQHGLTEHPSSVHRNDFQLSPNLTLYSIGVRLQI